ncbi:MAG: DegT/DnrJ/EryC1/StrS aminotransferase family protein [Alphaproteobacteria bacterium]|nr:DegT/DnrJ/EryC1/StrS aminotransferase family protein [Alphaproteobacteria bacterium]
MSNHPIPFGRPLLDAEEIEAVTRVLSGPTLVHGPVSHAFEQRFAERVGSRHAVSLSSCTAGLHLSLLVNGVGPGDAVAVPAMTHVATAHAVEFCGARPRFVDVEADSGNIDPEDLAAAVTPALKAIMVVHYLGLPCDMDRILALAEKAGAFVVEDCALAVDATYGGAKAGTLGLTGCFSFYPIKHMTTVEGGMVTTDDEDVATAIAQRKAFGYDRALGQRAKPGIYDVTALGYNYRMSEVQAAVGLSQLGKLDAFQRARAENHRILKSALAELDEITVFEPLKGKAVSSHYCLNAVLPRDRSVARDRVVASLKEVGVGTSVHYPRAVPLMTYYRDKYGYREGQFPVAEWLAEQTISLPVGPHLKEGDALRIAEAFKEAVRRARA